MTGLCVTARAQDLEKQGKISLLSLFKILRRGGEIKLPAKLNRHMITQSEIHQQDEPLKALNLRKTNSTGAGAAHDAGPSALSQEPVQELAQGQVLDPSAVAPDMKNEEEDEDSALASEAIERRIEAAGEAVESRRKRVRELFAQAATLRKPDKAPSNTGNDAAKCTPKTEPQNVTRKPAPLKRSQTDMSAIGEEMRAANQARLASDSLGMDLIESLSHKSRNTSPPGLVNRKMFYEALGEMGVDSELTSSDFELLFAALVTNGNGQVEINEVSAAIKYILYPDGQYVDRDPQTGALKTYDAFSRPEYRPSKGVVAGLHELVDGNKNSDGENPVQRLRDGLTAQASRVIDLFKRWDQNGDVRVAVMRPPDGPRSVGMPHTPDLLPHPVATH